MLTNTNIIDLVTQEKDAGYWLIIVVEPGEWNLANADYLLQEKVNLYLSYALEGQMTLEYPDVDLDHFEIHVHYVSEPPQNKSPFLDRMKEQVGRPEETRGMARPEGAKVGL